MKSFLAVLLAFACASCATPVFARGRDGNMMVCNATVQAPPQATPQNLLQTVPARVYSPLPATDAPTFIVKTRSGVDLKALQAINDRQETTDKAPLFVSK